ncbi:AraC family transcriptional regulator [Acinetobacter calcoaceticus]|uniref:AraC family transcriptional regulator n=1 Tax=Acinetobacter calcoaceticus TaxID=471 RepID=A0A4R1XNQ3_ACICA|nr:AraC family transcriptional regulator [Acinetobacter calcoaceticus]
MAWVNASTDFDADRLPQPVLAVASEFQQHHSPLHQHHKGQLLYITAGYVEVYLQEAHRYCVLTPQFMVWIPPQTLHKIKVKQRIQYHSVWIDPDEYALLKQTKIFLPSTLLSAVLQRMMSFELDQDWQQGMAQHLIQLCLAELQQLDPEPLLLPLPQSAKIRSVLDQFALPPSRSALAAALHISEKTLTRQFQKDTQLSYQQWRQNYKLMLAIKLLAEKKRISEIADHLEFSSDSAFIYFFKQLTGCSPSRYF